jgi:arylsulfatase A-like enzyme
MKKLLCLIVVLCSFQINAQNKTDDRPNVIVIFVDDLGYADLGIQNQLNDVKTPNIDYLAKTGVRMTSGYVTAPQCVPSRAGLLTGRYQEKFGTDHNGTLPLPLNEITIAQRMKDAGYVTGMTGKWHLEPLHVQKKWMQKEMPELGSKKKYEPRDIPFAKKIPYMSNHRGFDQVFQGSINRYWSTYTLDGKDKKEGWVDAQGYRLDIQTDAAVSFIKKNKDTPFFFYLSYFAPHVPLEATRKYLSRFPDDMPTRRKYCLAMMSAIDDGVGRVKQTLKNLKLEDNTIIFFISDNGAPLKIEMKDLPISFRGGAWDGSRNDPLNGEKGMISEGGIRVPYIVNWPAGLPKGKVYDKPVISLDVAATSIALAGLEKAEELDGVNLIPYLNDDIKEEPHDALYWRFWKQFAVRSGKFKYLKQKNREFLFDLEADISEVNNIIEQYPQKAKELKAKLSEWNKTLFYKDFESSDKEQESRWFNHYFPKK